MRRIDADLFYDPAVVGLIHGDRKGPRGLPQGRFYRAEDPLAERPHFLVRVAKQHWAFASILFGFGFFAVFVRQADFLIQVILGAPIFEEMVKFGLAMLVSLALVSLLSGFRDTWRHPAWALVRVPVALAVGASFGILEHEVTYSSESGWSYTWRILFHALSTGASMVAYQAALPQADTRTRWLALIPSIAVHYLNNYGAIVLGIGGVLIPVVGWLASLLSGALVLALAAALVTMTAVPRWTGQQLARLAERLPVETRRGA